MGLEEALYIFSGDLDSTIKVLKWAYLTESAASGTPLDIAADTLIRLMVRWKAEIETDFCPAVHDTIRGLHGMSHHEWEENRNDRAATLIERADKAAGCIEGWDFVLRAVNRAYLKGMPPAKLIRLHWYWRRPMYTEVVTPYVQEREERRWHQEFCEMVAAMFSDDFVAEFTVGPS